MIGKAVAVAIINSVTNGWQLFELNEVNLVAITLLQVFLSVVVTGTDTLPADSLPYPVLCSPSRQTGQDAEPVCLASTQTEANLRPLCGS
jgi:hypothetical protein